MPKGGELPAQRTAVQVFLSRLDRFVGVELFSVERPLLIGRKKSAELCLDADTVSRRHARLVYVDGVLALEDLSSGNGTFLNGKRISGTTSIKPSDAIQIGPFTLKLRLLLPTGLVSAVDPMDDVTTRIEALLTGEGSEGSAERRFDVQSEQIDRRVYEDALRRASNVLPLRSPLERDASLVEASRSLSPGAEERLSEIADAVAKIGATMEEETENGGTAPGTAVDHAPFGATPREPSDRTPLDARPGLPMEDETEGAIEGDTDIAARRSGPPADELEWCEDVVELVDMGTAAFGKLLAEQLRAPAGEEPETEPKSTVGGRSKSRFEVVPAQAMAAEEHALESEAPTKDESQPGEPSTAGATPRPSGLVASEASKLTEPGALAGSPPPALARPGTKVPSVIEELAQPVRRARIPARLVTPADLSFAGLVRPSAVAPARPSPEASKIVPSPAVRPEASKIAPSPVRPEASKIAPSPTARPEPAPRGASGVFRSPPAPAEGSRIPLPSTRSPSILAEAARPAVEASPTRPVEIGRAAPEEISLLPIRRARPDSQVVRTPRAATRTRGVSRLTSRAGSIARREPAAPPPAPREASGLVALSLAGEARSLVRSQAGIAPPAEPRSPAAPAVEARPERPAAKASIVRSMIAELERAHSVRAPAPRAEDKRRAPSEAERRAHLIAEPMIDSEVEVSAATAEVSARSAYFEGVEITARASNRVLDITTLRREGEEYVLGHPTSAGGMAPSVAHPGLRLLKIDRDRNVDLVFPLDVAGHLVRDGETVTLRSLTEGRKYSCLRLKAQDIVTLVLGRGAESVTYHIRFTRTPRSLR